MPRSTNFDPRRASNGVAYGLLAAIIWGAWPVFSRLGVSQSLSAYDLTALRFGVSGLVLLPIVLRHGTAGLGWHRALVLAAGAGVPYVLISISGLSFAPAGHAGVITPSCMLMFSSFGGWWLLGDRPNRQRLCGMGLIVGGVALIGGQAFAGRAPGVWAGDLMFAAAGFLWAGYTVAARRWSVDPFQATALVSVISMVLYVPGYLAFNPTRIIDAPISEVLFQGLFQGVFAAILALVAYTRAVEQLGAARGALFAALVPVIATLLAVPVLGEQPSMAEWLGVVTVTAGIIWALSPGRTHAVRRANRFLPGNRRRRLSDSNLP